MPPKRVAGFNICYDSCSSWKYMGDIKHLYSLVHFPVDALLVNLSITSLNRYDTTH